jgi:hypothetical protein
LFAQDMGEILARAASIFEVMRAAAKTESEINQHMQHLLKERLENMTSFARHLAANGPLRDDMDAAHAGETLWALTSPELFNLLILDLGWPKEKYSEWLANSLIKLLLP